jgi:heptaprenyl diphosphate synthase
MLLGKANFNNRKTLAILGATCLFLSTIEYLLPKPLPFIRLGIANLPLLLALDILPLSDYLLLLSIKVIGQSLVSGSLFSYVFIFSALGSLCSASSMYFLRYFINPSRLSLIGIGTIGALVSNLSQIILARYFIFGPSAFFIMPPFLGIGIITGILLGMFSETFISRSKWYLAHSVK